MKRGKPLRRSEFKRGPGPKRNTAIKKFGKSRVTKTRTILIGKDYTHLRRQKAEAANECCEQCGKSAPYVPGPDLPLWAGQLCHRERGSKRDSTDRGTFWGCRSCHDRFDGRDVKPCPPKPRRVGLLEPDVPKPGM